MGRERSKEHQKIIQLKIWKRWSLHHVMNSVITIRCLFKIKIPQRNGYLTTQITFVCMDLLYTFVSIIFWKTSRNRAHTLLQCVNFENGIKILFKYRKRYIFQKKKKKKEFKPLCYDLFLIDWIEQIAWWNCACIPAYQHVRFNGFKRNFTCRWLVDLRLKYSLNVCTMSYKSNDIIDERLLFRERAVVFRYCIGRQPLIHFPSS